jgi:2-polyprenyl-3-methyl-5-hydroxy-6-metoxy-1,4-benzoquinol methylase
MTAQILSFLKEQSAAYKGLDRIKFAYRPYVCPFELLMGAIPRGAKVVDIGCGNGSLLAVVAHFLKPGAVAGLEVKQSLVDQACQVLSPYGAKIELFDGENLPTWIGEYSHVVLNDVLHHVPKARQKKFIQTIVDKMAPNATLVLKDIDADHTVLCWFNKLHDLILSKEIGHERGARELERWLSQLDGKITSHVYQRTLVYPHVLFSFQKGSR